jgi:hypothetical protein
VYVGSIDFAAMKLPELAHLAKILDTGVGSVPTDALLGLVETYGLPRVVVSLEVLASSALPTEDPHAISLGGAGGGGGGWTSPDGPPNMLADLVLFLEFWMQRLPAYLFRSLSGVIAQLLPALVNSVYVPPQAAALSATMPVTVPVTSVVVVHADTSSSLSLPTSAAPPAPTSGSPESTAAPFVGTAIASPGEVPPAVLPSPQAQLPPAPDAEVTVIETAEIGTPGTDSSTPQDPPSQSGSEAYEDPVSDGGSSGGSGEESSETSDGGSGAGASSEPPDGGDSSGGSDGSTSGGSDGGSPGSE